MNTVSLFAISILFLFLATLNLYYFDAIYSKFKWM